jgi:gamma-glutamyl-gamma-aminobutyrate hydrolase PuuD
MKIGIPMSSSKTQFFINQAYVDYVVKAGFEPILFSQLNNINYIVDDILDGLLLPGGIDIDPIYYGEDNTNSFVVDQEKDDFERRVFYKAKDKGIPIFGICRGFQLIAREFIMQNPEIEKFIEFLQHINNHNQVDNQQLARNSCQHFVNYIPKDLYNNTEEITTATMPVNSMHHQCLITDFKKPNVVGIQNFKMLAWTKRGLKSEKKNDTHDFVCEAFKITKWGSRILCVQWHPEELMDTELILNFFTKKKKVQQA